MMKSFVVCGIAGSNRGLISHDGWPVVTLCNSLKPLMPQPDLGLTGAWPADQNGALRQQSARPAALPAALPAAPVQGVILLFLHQQTQETRPQGHQAAKAASVHPDVAHLDGACPLH